MNALCMVTEEMWRKIKEIQISLEPANRATKKLQYKNITLSDISKILNVCHMKTAEIGEKYFIT